jgi:EpsI family protein
MTTRTRLLIVTVFLLATAAYLAQASRAEAVAMREPLAMCPTNISDWKGQPAANFDERTLAVLGVDEYLNRVYVSAQGRPIGLYIGYYGSQRQGDTMHSPQNCLPGAGWTPVRFDRIQIPVGAGSSGSASAPAEGAILVNRYLIEKGLDRQVVIYWYQSHGRTIASEYWGKIYLVLDAIRTNRTDGALVRIVAPIVTSEEDAAHDAIEFARVLYPLLGRYLPS